MLELIIRGCVAVYCGIVVDLASRLLLDKLKKARGINDLELLQMTVQDCKAGGLADHKGVAKAERQMKLIEMKTSKYSQFKGYGMEHIIHLLRICQRCEYI